MPSKQKRAKISPFSHSHAELEKQRYVVFADANRHYVDCSDGVCELLGYEKSEVLSKTIDDLSYITADVPAMYERFVKSRALDGRYLLKHKDGHPVSITYQSWVLPDGCLAAVWQPAAEWQQLYHKALLEFDPGPLKRACTIALAAIEDHARECESDSAASPELQSDLSRSAATLRLLLNEPTESQ